MSLYPKNDTPALDLELFQNPTAEYRGTPFWSWNSKLDRDQLMRQIDVLKAMGMGGFHIHARTGLATEYLGDEFMGLVRACVEKARREQMLAWLYDEDRWPSGFAGGLVTREPRFRARHLLLTCVPYGEPGPPPFVSNTIRADRTTRTGGELIARYHVALRGGRLAAYHRLGDGELAPPDGTIWYAYVESAIESPWFNNQTYVDTLSKPAIERFVAITHERYAEVVGQDFGGVIPAIFTDEPQFMRVQSLRRADDKGELVIPWTPDLPETYQAAYGQRLEDHLPELFWELPDGKVSLARYRFHDHVTERFAEAFADTLGDWCDAHGLMLTGHMMEEPTLQSQTAAIGEAMRSYRGFALPGIDMLCDRREYTTAKQAQSAAHQYGRPGVLSELYGVTNWDFDFVGHKAQGDWQAALGVTVRVHHLAWVSMAGEAKRDYPAAIGYQSPWWQEYRLVEDHFARLNTALTRGRPLVRVGVVHPIESYWLCYGPLDQTAVERAERERAFADLTSWLLFGLIDFDFIAESLLPSLCPNDEGRRTKDESAENDLVGDSSFVVRPSAGDSPALAVGEMRYDAVLVPPLRTIRATTLERLEAFQAAGGTVIFAGEAPELVDAVPSERARELARRCRQVAFARGAILDAARELSARQADGSPADSLLHQVRADGDRRYVFFCNTDRERARPATQITIAGEWRVTMLDTMTGAIAPLRAQVQGAATRVDWSFAPHGSLLLVLSPLPPASPPSALRLSPMPGRGGEASWREIGRIDDPVPVTLSEPNVLLLDQAAYRLNDEEWQPTEEVLQLDTALRQRLGLPLRMAWVAQPWTDPNPAPPADTLSLMFTVQVDVAVDEPSLALENAAQTRIYLDGRPVPSDVTGWFVDEAIQTMRLPRLEAGAHRIALTMPYGRKTNPEWCYLLGDFGVEVRGRHARIVAPVRELAFGDWTRQGLPFYAGNVTYHCTVAGQGANLAVKAPKFKSPLLSVALDGQAIGKIAFAPFQVELGSLADGPHALDITAYGNRINAFGCVHNADEKWPWFGPNAWRTTGDDWSYEYQLKPMGVLVAPQLLSGEG
jgi:hypothetical protein